MGGDSSLWCHEFESQHQSQTPLKEFNRCRQRQIWHWVVEVVKWSVCSPSTTTIWVRISLKPTVLSVKLWLKRTKIQKKGPGLCHLEKLTSSLGQLRQVFLRGSAFCCSYFRSCSTFYEQNKWLTREKEREREVEGQVRESGWESFPRKGIIRQGRKNKDKKVKWGKKRHISRKC